MKNWGDYNRAQAARRRALKADAEFLAREEAARARRRGTTDAAAEALRARIARECAEQDRKAGR
jgi:hypothetical protein